MAKNMRSIWKGHVSVGLMTIPVKVYNAIDTADKISFNEIHKGCGGRVGRVSPCKKCQQVLESDEIVKGFQYATDEYVTFTKEELSAIKLKSTKVVDVQGFVAAEQIDPMMVEAPYYLGPDGAVAEQTYKLLARALSKRRVAAIGKIVLRDREDTVAIVATPNFFGLMLLKLRQPGELRSIADVPLADGVVKADKAHMDLALTLVDSMAAKMDALDLKDRYREALQELVEAKINKREITLVESGESKVTAPGDIMSVLQASIDAATRKKSA